MSGSPVVLLHGLGVDHRMWALQVGALQNRGQVLAPDLPGFGWQAPLAPAQRTPQAYADWVAGWLEARGAGPAAVLGYSMGGSIALLLARRHPRRVERLVLCCSSPRWGRGGRRWAGQAYAALGGGAAMGLFLRTIRWGCRRMLPTGAVRDAVSDMVGRAHRPTMGNLWSHLAALDLTPELGLLDLPATVIGGSRDLLAPPSHLRALARGLPQGRLQLLEGAGHMLCLSHSARFTQLLSRALASPAPPLQ